MQEFDRLGAFYLGREFDVEAQAPTDEPVLYDSGDLTTHAVIIDMTGKPRISVLSIAHLSDAERMFFVTMLLNELISWMRRQPGTGSLRAVLYMDKIFGYLPPTANPPTKNLFLTLLKQARAYGLGLVLATQNPVDLDYKALSNAGTWFMGRKRTPAGGAGGALRKVGRMRKESADAALAEGELEGARAELQALNDELESELQRLSENLDVQSEELEQILIRPRAADINIRYFGAAWTPRVRRSQDAGDR